MQDLRIIDTLAPFGVPNSAGPINWSKVDFAALGQNGELNAVTIARILERSKLYLQRARAAGYNAVSVDDLAHLAVHNFYPPPLKRRLATYQKMYAQFFALAHAENMRIFITTDFLFHNAAISAHLHQTGTTVERFFEATLQNVFRSFPKIDGIILRIGETDGRDVHGDFVSQLQLRTPGDANIFLKTILPFFEQTNKTLIFRTWTVGVHKIGDLIWNRATFNTVFGDIASANLVISMKFGETDFMRYLKLNPLFFTSDHKKIIELQTRREWEGMGQLPSFVGWDYQTYRDQLADAKNMIGIYVWCQTGGWSSPTWANATFLDDGLNFWDELNTFVTAQLFKGISVETALADFCAAHGIVDVRKFIALLRLADQVICEGLYIKEFASQQLYFRRTRLPTLLWVMWDTVRPSDVMATLLRTFVRDKQQAMREGYTSAKIAQHMAAIGNELHLPKEVLRSLAFTAATFTIFAKMREHALVGLDATQLLALQKDITAYEKIYPHHYVFAAEPLRQPAMILQILIRIVVRHRSAYRILDRVLLATSPFQKIIARHYFAATNPQLTQQAMGITAIFE